MKRVGLMAVFAFFLAVISAQGADIMKAFMPAEAGMVRYVLQTIKGWGYTRYTVKKIGPMAGTLMGVDPNVPKVDRFITLGGEPYIIRYNSRIPVVVYVPEGVEVRYRIWTTGAEMKVIEKG